MDDFVICTKTRHHLNRAIKKMHKELKELRKHIPTTGEYLKFSKKNQKAF